MTDMETNDTRRLPVLSARVECGPLHATLSVGTCAQKHVKARDAWKRELALRTVGRPMGVRASDRGEFGPCRDCKVGAKNAAEAWDAT